MALFEKWAPTEKDIRKWKKRKASGMGTAANEPRTRKCGSCHVHPVARSGKCTACISIEKDAAKAKANRAARMKKKAG